MYILGDIGNSETKVYLVNSKNKVIRNINFPSKQINNKTLNKKFKYLIKDFKSIKISFNGVFRIDVTRSTKFFCDITGCSILYIQTTCFCIDCHYSCRIAAA